jgi:thymidylate synthase (FAD)
MRFKSVPDVDLVDYMGSDAAICNAARVSTVGEKIFSYNSPLPEEESFSSTLPEERKNRGLIQMLMRDRHGSPFEHGAMTFRVHAPIFVLREFQRHRVGFSYNEESQRYREVDDPVFWLPRTGRKTRQEGPAARYRLVEDLAPGADERLDKLRSSLVESYSHAWSIYTGLLQDGVAREVARACLPTALFSSMYVTCNPRSLMHFLSLRTTSSNAAFPSNPQAEIEDVAALMEVEFNKRWPITHQAFHDCGRIAP